MFWWRAVRSAAVVAALVLVAACGEDEQGVKARIGEVWDLNIHTNMESINGLSAVVVRKAEVQFDGEDEPIPLEATSANRRTWLTMIQTEGFFQSVDPHDPISFKLQTVVPDNPDWVGRTGRIRWDVTILYPRVDVEDTDRFVEKTKETRVEYAIKFLEKSKDG